MKCKAKVSIHNEYTIYKEHNGCRTKVAKFTNLVLDSFYKAMATDAGVYPYAVWFGTGTSEPLASDTKLTKGCWQPTDNMVESYGEPYIAEDGSWNIMFSAYLPATTSYVGTVTEVGIYFYATSNFLGTKALIKDSEGNPISITKADNEKLIIDVHMQILLSGSDGFTWNPYFMYDYYNTYRYGNSGSNAVLGTVYIPSFMSLTITLLEAWPDIFSSGNNIKSNVSYNIIRGSQSYNAATKILTYSKGRFDTEYVTTQRYVNAISINGGRTSTRSDLYYNSPIPLGWIAFPNADIFPNYTLDDLPVGVGDGIITEFKPPLNYWVKDTDKVYVDGVLQTRGVDYTCDNINNLDNLPELYPTAFSTLHNKVIQIGSVTVNGYATLAGMHPFKQGAIAQSYKNLEYRPLKLEWDAQHPLMWELDPDNPLGNTADIFCFDIGFKSKDSNEAYIDNVTIILYGSNDNTNWTEIDRTTYTPSLYSDKNRYTTYKHTFTFDEPKTYKYWKLDADVSNCCEATKTADFYANTRFYIKHLGKNIVFTNPPASGAKITMSADIDRPMKNSNFIIDFNPTFQF